MGDGAGTVLSAAFGYASSLFSYFSPSRSPYYAMTVTCVVALCAVISFDNAAWVAAFIPIAIVLLFLSALTMKAGRFQFSKEEYNDQLKFARSLSVTTAIVCIVFLVLNESNPLGYGPVTGGPAPETCTGDNPCDLVLRWTITIVYFLCLVQIALFLAYAFVFGHFDELVKQQESAASPAGATGNVPSPARLPERNYVQIALIMSAFLAGSTYIVNRSDQTYEAEILILLLFGMLWAVCAFQVLLFVRRNFKLQVPIDIEPIQRAGTNVITIKQVA